MTCVKYIESVFYLWCDSVSRHYDPGDWPHIKYRVIFIIIIVSIGVIAYVIIIINVFVIILINAALM